MRLTIFHLTQKDTQGLSFALEDGEEKEEEDESLSLRFRF
jgi:hypothetical protein